ncbi:ferredoxin family protein [Paraconexibacter sp.]|uniref:4Fe-4S dicluster domain-containing protein n=1 Tax=Paraconexibacter sp. TaxID=2949640 RepID=UPI0035632D45
MRKDDVFIAVEVSDAVASDPALGAKLDEVCPVGIFKGTDGGVDIVQENLDECVLCGLCYDAVPAGGVSVLKLYEDGVALR